MTIETLKQVEFFLNRISIKMQEFTRAKRLYQRRLAPDFSPFQFIAKDELNLSRLIAWMLDRDGSHGQGVAFLKIFVKELALDWTTEQCEAADRPALEVSIAKNGRLDILLTSGNSQIVIENKPYAIDQLEQVRRYLDYLDQRMLDTRKLLYITAHGTDPAIASVGKDELDRRKLSGELKLVNYSSDVIVWLDECFKECGSDRVRLFVEQFRSFILREFKGVTDVSERDELVEYMASTKETISAAIAVSSARDELQNRLLEKLKEQISEIVPSDIGFSWNVNRFERLQKSGFEFDYSATGKFVFRVEFYSTGLRDPNYGLKAKDQEQVTKEEAAEANKAISESSIGARREGGTLWPWWGKGREDSFLALEDDWNLSDRPWLAIHDGTLARSVVDAAIRVRAAING
jgi:hypothetical protein